MLNSYTSAEDLFKRYFLFFLHKKPQQTELDLNLEFQIIKRLEC
jgi:hypothetical protein